MYRDMVAGLPVEADEIVGDLARRATEKGVAVPLLNAAYTNLAVYSAARAGKDN
jgi:2-dehydropantoate 2-reductase